MKPLLSFDLETTGGEPRPDCATDRAITLGIVPVYVPPAAPEHFRAPKLFKFNPMRAITAEATAKHGMTAETVRAWPSFAMQAEAVLAAVAGADLIGFNILAYDVPLLYEEFTRAGVKWDTSDLLAVDVGMIYKLKESRTLDDAKRLYLGDEAAQYQGHDAIDDATATCAIYHEQRRRYPDLGAMDIAALARFSQGDRPRADFAGKLYLDAEGYACYAIGKAAGTRVKDDPGFGRWMLGKDFAAQTKDVLRRELKKWGS